MPPNLHNMKTQEITTEKKAGNPRRLELIQPILDRINKALQDIGKEENYSFIFDNANGILFYKDSEDISAKLYKKLGQ